MITKRQHKDLCRNLYILRLNGIEVNTYDGRRIISVDVEKGEIKITFCPDCSGDYTAEPFCVGCEFDDD